MVVALQFYHEEHNAEVEICRKRSVSAFQGTCMTKIGFRFLVNKMVKRHQKVSKSARISSKTKDVLMLIQTE